MKNRLTVGRCVTSVAVITYTPRCCKYDRMVATQHFIFHIMRKHVFMPRHFQWHIVSSLSVCPVPYEKWWSTSLIQCPGCGHLSHWNISSCRMETTKVQISLSMRSVWSVSLLLLIWKVWIMHCFSLWDWYSHLIVDKKLIYNFIAFLGA